MDMGPSHKMTYKEALEAAYILNKNGQSLRSVSDFVLAQSGTKISYEGLRKKFKSWTANRTYEV